MKKILLIAITIFLAFGCSNDLNKEPDFISENSIFEDKALTEAYMAQLYSSMQFFVHSGFGQVDIGLFSAMGAEHINFADWQGPNQAVLRSYTQETGAGPLGYWPYVTIREINNLIENIIASNNLSQDYIDEKILEARFLRAYTYFEMVKRYGGVPLITTVQSADDPEEELFPKRNTEQEVYDFIYNELSDIVAQSSDERKGALGRVDKYAALALQSRAMLYAASIANFGQVQIDGIVGIPSGAAQSYYQKSYDASKALMNSGTFSLFDRTEDKVQNFTDLFLTEGFDNPEVIFAEVFEPEVKGHNLDYLAYPDGFNTVWNSNFPVLYDFVELFEWKDGRQPIPRSMLTASNTWDVNDFFGERDPRFVASVFYPQTSWRDQEVYFHTNTSYTNDNGEFVTTNQGTITKDGIIWPAAGPARNVRNTGLLLRKRLDPNIPLSGVLPEQSGQDYFVFRYGETLLNLAEAAFYLGNDTEALTTINTIRDRAGMPSRTVIDEDAIRLERQVELAFENHRFWDMIRWRTAVDVLDGKRTQGLIFRYNLDTDLYTITLKNAESQVRSFGPERYYLPIGQDLISDNPNLVQNPGY